MKDRHLFAGLVRLHILHHASHGGVFGVGLMEKLGHHGYKLSAGTLYPILHEATQTGKEVLRLGKDRVRELYRELLEET